MADELDRVGVSYRDEAAVRADVAADIAVRSSAAVRAEQEKAAAIRAKISETEAALDKLLAEGQEDVAAGRLTQAAFDFRVKNMSRSIESLTAQVGIQDRAVERVVAAEKKRALAREAEDAGRAAAAAAIARNEDARLAAGHGVQSRDQLQLGRQLFVAPAGGGVGGGGGTAGAAGARRGGTSGNSGIAVDPRHVRGPNATTTAAVDDYRGGEVLTAVNNVTVKTLGKAAKVRQRIDDGDATLFAARQAAEKRKRKREQRRAAKIASKVSFGKAGRREDGSLPGGADPSSSDDESSTTSSSSSSTSSSSCSSDDDTDDDEDAQQNLMTIVPGWYIDAAVFEALLPYQQTGVRWLIGLATKRTGGILGDEMGLGKTVQIAAFLNALHNSGHLLGPALIVAPLTVLYQWVTELHKWCPKLRVVVFHSSGSATGSRQDVIQSVKDQPAVVLTTYAAVSQQNSILQSANFHYVILDEGHKISNPDASVTVACKSFTTPHRIVLTGSPIQNTLKELWCLFDFVCPGLLGYQQKFVDEFEAPIAASRNPRATELQIETAVECAKVLRAHIAPYMLRRLKRDVNAMLPPKHERVVRCLLSDSQLEQYCEILQSPDVQQYMAKTSMVSLERGRLDRNNRGADGGLVSGMRRSGISEGMTHQAFRVLSQLRMLCNHVDLWKLKQEDIAEGGTGSGISFRSNNPVDLTSSGKLATLARLLTHWKANGHKALIFSQTRMMLDIIENLVEQGNYKYIRMDGNTPSKHRGILIDKFNEDDSINVALLTTKVGGLGVNLTGANRVVIFDPDWNPVTDEQARERAWRIGQRREVCVYRMITAGTVEEHILHRQLAKTYVTDKVLKDPTLQRFFTINQLSDAFFLGSEYAERVPPTAKMFVIAGNTTANLVDEIDQEMLREEDDDNLAAFDAAATQTMAVKPERAASATVKPERRATGRGGGRGGSGAAAAASVRVKKEEGTGDSDLKSEARSLAGVAVIRAAPGSGGPTNGSSGRTPSASGGPAAAATHDPNSQTAMLANLVDQGTVASLRPPQSDNGDKYYRDPMGQRLVQRMATATAATVMQRAVSGANSGSSATLSVVVKTEKTER